MVRVKVERVGEASQRQVALEPSEGSSGLFGWNTISSDAKEVCASAAGVSLSLLPTYCVQVVITGTEFDAVAVHQATEVPAVALPSGNLSLPPEVDN